MQILDALAERGNVKMFFHHGLRKMSLDQNTVEFENMSVYLFLYWYSMRFADLSGGSQLQEYEGDCSRANRSRCWSRWRAFGY